jgi:hypothetical protein
MQNHNTESKKEFCEVYASPNPTKGITTLRFGLFGFSDATVVIRDIMGKIILMKDFKVSNDKIQINLEQLSSGVYLLNVENEVLKSKQIKIIIFK